MRAIIKLTTLIKTLGKALFLSLLFQFLFYSYIFSQDTINNKKGRLRNVIQATSLPSPEISNSTTPTNPVPDLRELYKRIMQLEAEVNAIKNKIPFQSMAFVD